MNVQSAKEIKILQSRNLLTLSDTVPTKSTGISIDSSSSNSVSISASSNIGNYSRAGYDIELTDLNIQAGETVTISAGITGSYTGVNGATLRVAKNGSGDAAAIIKILNTTTTKDTFVVPSGTTSLGFFFYITHGQAATAGSTATFTNIQLEKGPTATDYEPYVAPQDVRTIHDKDKKLIWGKVQYDTKYMGDLEQANYPGKNLFNYQGVVDLALSGTGGGTVQSQTTYRSFYWKVSAGDVYTISRATSSGNNRCRIAFTMVEPANGVAWYGQYGVQGANYYDAGSALSITITVPQNMEYAILYLSNQDDDITESLHYQVELGSTATTYEPYVGGVPSPNPDYPQPINVVKGTQTIDIYGKNMLNVPNQTLTSSGVTWVWKNGKVTVSATSTTGTSSYACQPVDINIVKGNPYVFSLANTTTVDIALQGDNNGTWETLATVTAGSVSSAFVATKNYTRFQLRSSGWASGAAISTSINGVQLEVKENLLKGYNNSNGGIQSIWNGKGDTVHSFGTATGDYTWVTGAVNKKLAAGTYMLVVSSASEYAWRFRAYTGENATGAYDGVDITSGNTSGTVTLAEQKLSYRVTYYNFTSGARIDIQRSFIFFDTTPSPYEAYQHSTKKISLSSKNLLRIPSIEELKTLNSGSGRTWSGNTLNYHGIDYVVNNDGSISVSGIAESTGSYLILGNTGDMGLVSGGSYTLSGCPSGGNVRLWSLRVYVGSNYSTDSGSGVTISYTNSGNVRINIFADTELPTGGLTFWPQLEAGIEATTYEPYHIVLGNNLFDKSVATLNSILTWVAGADYASTGSVTSDYLSTSDGAVYSSNFYMLIFCYNSSKTYLGHIKADGTLSTSSGSDADYEHTKTIPSGQNVAFIRVVWRSGAPASAGDKNPNDMTTQSIMLNYGSTAATYEPYTQTPLELAGLTQAQDYFYYSNGIWTIRKEITTVTVTGSEYWTKLNSAFQTSTGTTPGAKSTTAAGSACSDYFIYYPTQSSITSNIPDGQFGWNTSLALTIRNDSCADAAAFKTWLAAHPTTIYYPLATAADTAITYPSLVAQLEAIRDWMIRAGYTQTVVGDLPIIINKEDL